MDNGIIDINERLILNALRSTGSRLLCRDTTEEEGVTAGGIITPASAQKLEFNAVVIDPGPEADKRIKKGTKIIYQLQGCIKVIPDTVKNVISVPMGNVLAFYEEE